jgi:hypothetical protein
LPQPDSEPGSEVVREVLSYFVRNPQAADSLEGVARWRLLEEQVYRTVQETEAAVAYLVSQGFLEATATAGSAKIFRMRADRVAEAIRFLARRPARPGKKEP